MCFAGTLVVLAHLLVHLDAPIAQGATDTLDSESQLQGLPGCCCGPCMLNCI